MAGAVTLAGKVHPCLPPWAPLYLHGLSSGDFVPALDQFLAGLSSSTVTRLTETWTAEAAAFAARDLSGVDNVYLWVDGIHLGIRLGEGMLYPLRHTCPGARYRRRALGAKFPKAVAKVTGDAWSMPRTHPSRG